MQNVATLSRKVSVINRNSFNLDLPRNTAEMLYHGGGIHVQKSQSGGGSPLIRGFEANRVLLVIDGVRIIMLYIGPVMYIMLFLLTLTHWKGLK